MDFLRCPHVLYFVITMGRIFAIPTYPGPYRKYLLKPRSAIVKYCVLLCQNYVISVWGTDTL
jgi:hypothetical protein